MEKFGVIEAAFDVFKRRDRRGVLFQAALGYVLILLVTTGVFLALSAPVLLDYLRWADELQKTQKIGQLPPNVSSLLGGYFVFGLLGFAALAAWESAAHRWLVRGEAGGGLMGLKIDAHFWNVLLCYLTWIPMYIGIVLLVVLVGGAGIGGGIASGGGLVGFLLGLVGVLAAIALGAYLPARFAPASALSVARGRYAFFEAWKATRGHALSLIGAFLLLFVGFYVVVFAISVPMQGSANSLTGELVSGTDFLQALGSLGVFNIAILAAIYVAMMVFQLAFISALFGVNAKLARVATAAGMAADTEPMASSAPPPAN